MGLFTLHNCCVSWLLNLLKLKLDSQSRLTIPEFSGYHCKCSNTLKMQKVFRSRIKETVSVISGDPPVTLEIFI